MRVAIIGRSENLYDTAKVLAEAGHEIVLVISAKEAPEYTRTLGDFRQLAATVGAEFVHAPSMTATSDAIDAIQRALPLDIGISYNYTGVIPQKAIDLFSLGILNAHGGDLPRYRGNACQAWAILNGESKIGLCVHKMIGGELDSGDIVTRDYLPIGGATKITAVVQWMALRIPALMKDAVQALSHDPAYILEPQSSRQADILRCYPRRPEDARIKWTSKAIEILRLINASNKPYSGAFCEFETMRLTIWDAELLDDGEVFCAIPGQVTAIGSGHIDVACGKGKLRIKSIEVDAQPMVPNDLIHSLRSRLT
ncbi:Fmt Methionyl-tRNA formyltransferase [Comamonadaceae bacterium]